MDWSLEYSPVVLLANLPVENVPVSHLESPDVDVGGMSTVSTGTATRLCGANTLTTEVLAARSHRWC